MRKTIFILIAIASFIVMAIVACTNISSNVAEIPKLDSAALVKRGEYLVRIVGCDDCHSPKRMGPHGPEVIPELRLSGFPHNGQWPPVDTTLAKQGFSFFMPDLTATIGPWGKSFAANITSDASGIGNWPMKNFVRAMREGKYKGLETGRSLLPPMPWNDYKNMTDEDIHALFYYLKTTKPVKNVAPGPMLLSEIK